MSGGEKLFIHCRRLEELPYPLSSPFNTSRAGKVKDKLESMGLLKGVDRKLIEPKAAGREILEKFHTAEYLDAMVKAEAGEFDHSMLYMGLGTGDCPIFKGMYEYGTLAAGATVLGAEKILAGKARAAFNPSGGLHHAMPGRAAGFCYINDVVLGAIALAEGGKKVLCLDIDVHHGDGTQMAFYDRRDVMTISMHQSGRTLFPGTGFVDEIGVGEGKGCSVNLPMPPGTYDGIYMKAFDDAVMPLIKAFGADVLIVEIGADTLAGDPLAGLCLTNNVYADILEKLIVLDKPLLVTGGGGYHIDNTVRAWALVWTVLCGETDQHENIGMGGVMMESTEWQGGAGLRDRVLVPDAEKKERVEAEVEKVIGQVKELVFGIYGL